jgi:hypothetical protein
MTSELDPLAQPPSPDSQSNNARHDPLSTLQLTELLGALVVIVGAFIWVMLNAFYVEFYDDFGVRPEDVGWDRLTVLSRAAWLALIVIGGVGAVLLLFVILGEGFKLGGKFKLTRSWRMLVAVAAAALFVAVLVAGFLFLKHKVEAEAANVRRGDNVDGINAWGILVLDVRASWAQIEWIDDKTPKPPSLNSPYLAYIGKNDKQIVLYACGTNTIIVPADKVVLTILSGSKAKPSAKQEASFAY